MSDLSDHPAVWELVETLKRVIEKRETEIATLTQQLALMQRQLDVARPPQPTEQK